jgi:hypothetical protein
METFDYELILNDITYGESSKPFDKDFEDYKKMAFLFLNRKGRHLFEQDILKEYSEGMTLAKLLEQNKDRFIQGSNLQKDGAMQKTWYDISGMDEIRHDDTFFDYFFTCKLRHLSLLDIEAYLEFHLGYSFKNNTQEYFRFLLLTIRKYKDQLLNTSIIETVNEWIKAKELAHTEEHSCSAEKEDQIKGRRQREAGDQWTCLNQNQTVLLIEFMQKAGIILNGDLLNYTQAGKAFQILTGYSAQTIRQQLGIKGINEGVKFEDYTVLYEAVKRLTELIEPKVRQK